MPALLALREVAAGLEHYAHRVDVEYLFKGDVLGLHLAPDRVGALKALYDAGADAAVFNNLLYLAHEILYGAPLGGHHLLQLALYALVFL